MYGWTMVLQIMCRVQTANTSNTQDDRCKQLRFCKAFWKKPAKAAIDLNFAVFYHIYRPFFVSKVCPCTPPTTWMYLYLNATCIGFPYRFTILDNPETVATPLAMSDLPSSPGFQRPTRPIFQFALFHILVSRISPRVPQTSFPLYTTIPIFLSAADLRFRPPQDHSYYNTSCTYCNIPYSSSVSPYSSDLISSVTARKRQFLPCLIYHLLTAISPISQSQIEPASLFNQLPSAHALWPPHSNSYIRHIVRLPPPTLRFATSLICLVSVNRPHSPCSSLPLNDNCYLLLTIHPTLPVLQNSTSLIRLFSFTSRLLSLHASRPTNNNCYFALPFFLDYQSYTLHYITRSVLFPNQLISH